ncbi:MULTISPECIES: alpha/beta fold hydrolase [unclassified Variovorax]|jgi:3-oxoadipate enol-lactonase|uniref:alpha/beta fold hydrolase n=1 Tax=unclassified Variovorax TaxID=663243 RepID=UPI000F7E18A6|nr:MULTISPECIES: alpha/beta fold hydrolase [unclassified Variovorax]RSZ33319.1 alpha/beta fold hydrolase [Variovorax sp. 553]RSZ33691.1 alpha/beta fold hydrolase [Variovorax sp. 679]
MTRLNVVREGDGPIVVLSHALGCDLSMWDGVAAQLSRAHTVLRYDHRNHGASEVVPGALRVETLAQDVAELIQREAGGEPVHFVGLSMGGMTAQALAVRHPELLKTMVIANSAAHYPDQSPWRARVETVAAKGVAAIAPGAVSRWLTPAYVGTPEGAAAAEKLHDVLVRTDAQGYIESCNAVAAIDFRESNHRIAVPTLVIGGLQDEATPMAMSQAMVGAIPGARLATIDAAHLSAVERPVEFTQLLIDFWRSL